MKLVGAVAIKVRPDTSGFRRDAENDIERQLAGREVDYKVKAKVRADTTELKRDIARAKVAIEKERFKIKVGLDFDSVQKAQAQLRAAMAGINIKQIQLDDIDLDVNVSEETIERARHRLDSFINDEEDKAINLPVGLTGMSLVAARLSFAARTRHVSFLVTVNAKSLAVAEGLLRSLAGLNVLTSTGRFLENMITSFDQIAVKGAGWASVISSISSSLVFMATSLFGIGAGMAKMVGLLATLPAIGAALAAAVIVNVMAFKNFKSAIDGDVEALAALPPAAREAAQSLTGVWTSIQRPVQEAFWTTMGTSIQDFVTHVIPQLRDGLASVAPAAGSMLSNTLKAFTKLALGGDMKTMFSNLARSFEITALAAEPLVDAINTLGLRGSFFLPRMAQWLTDITIRFDNWIQKSEKAGDINRWIEEGVDALHATWQAGGAVVDMFRALAHSAEDAGTGGLLSFRDNMRSIADTMLGEPFRTRMALFFSGSREGASALNEGIRALGESFGTSAYWVDRMLVALGQLSGDALIQFSRVIGNIKFQDGLLTAVRDMQEALIIMTPGFERLGDIVGNLGVLAGGIFTNVAPIINSVMRIVGDSFDTLSGTLLGLIPTLTGLVNGLLVAFEGPFGTLVNIVNTLLTALQALPQVLQNIAVAMIGMFLLRGQFAPFFLAISNGWARMAASARGESTVITRSWTANGIVAREVATGIVASNAQIMASNAALLASYGRSAAGAAVTGAATVAAFQAAATGTQASFMRTAQAAAVASAATAAALRAPAAAAAAASAAVNLSNQATAASAARLAARIVVANSEIAAGSSIGARAVFAATNVMRGAFGTVAGAANVAAGGVQAAMARMGGAVAGGAARVATGIARIASSLYSLAGGWVGIGIMAIGTALAVMGANAAEAKGDLDALKGSLDDFGRVTAETKKLNVDKILGDNQANMFTNFTGSVKSASESILLLGGSIEQMGTLATDGGPKFDGIIQQLEKLAELKKASALQTTPSGSFTTAGSVEALNAFVSANGMAAGAVDLNVQSIQHLISFLNGLRDPTQKATSDWLLAHDGAEKASSATLAWNDALSVLNDTTATSSRRVEALKDALDILNGKSVDGFKITRNYNDAVRDMQGFLQDATTAAEGLDAAQSKAEGNRKRAALNSTVNKKTGVIDTSTDIGSSLSKQLEALQDKSIEVAIKVKDDGGSIEKVTASLEGARQKWITMASQAGISAESAGLAWDAMIGGIPKEVATALTLEGVDAASEKLGAFGAGLEAMQARRTIATILGDNQDLTDKLIASSTSLAAFDAVVATATADLDPTQAESVRQQLLVELAAYAASDPTAKANIDPALFNGEKARLMSELAVLNAQRPNPVVNAQIAEAQRKLDIINSALDTTDSKHPTPGVTLNGSGGVIGDLGTINSYLTNLDGKTANTYVVNRISSIFSEEHISNGRGSGGKTINANGNILDGRGLQTFANGGFSESHVAKIFTPRTNYRVFAEPETGGEAYIPMSASKRTRSTAILKEVAERFGYELKRNSTSFAGGTAVPGGGDSSGVTFNIKSITAVDTEAAVRKLRVSQMDALAVAGITNGGAV